MRRKSHDKRQSSTSSRGLHRLIDHCLVTFMYTIENAQSQMQWSFVKSQILKLVETD
jgi:hypothetical protein